MTLKKETLPFKVVDLAVALKGENARVVDAHEEDILLLVLHLVRINAVRLQLGGSLEKGQLRLGGRLVPHLRLVNLNGLQLNLLILTGNELQVGDVVALVLLRVVVSEFS